MNHIIDDERINDDVDTGHAVILGSPGTVGAYSNIYIYPHVLTCPSILVRYAQIGDDLESQVLEMEEVLLPLFTVFLFWNFFSLFLSIVFWCFQVCMSYLQRFRNVL